MICDWICIFTLGWAHVPLSGGYVHSDGHVYLEQTADMAGRWGGKTRAERIIPWKIDRETVFDFTITVPSDWPVTDQGMSVFDIHGVPDGGWKAPIDHNRSACFALVVRGDHWFIWHRFDRNAVTTGWPERLYGVEIPIRFGNPEHFRIKYKWSAGQEGGKITVKYNDKDIYKYVGPTCYNDVNAPFAKFGLYIWKWPDNEHIGYREIIFNDFSMEKK